MTPGQLTGGNAAQHGGCQYSVICENATASQYFATHSNNKLQITEQQDTAALWDTVQHINVTNNNRRRTKIHNH